MLKSHMELLRMVLVDSGIRCRTCTTRDLNTVACRVKDEGLSFLTITLPQFGKDLQKGLDQGEVDSSLFLGYKKNGRLPRFLGGFVSQIFNASNGHLLDEPSIDAIHSIMQISSLYAKVELPCSDTRIKAAFDKYIECEKQIKESDAALDPVLLERFKGTALFLWTPVLSKLDQMVYYGELRPKHGPGATADRLKGNQKFSQTEWTERLEGVFPHGENLFSSWAHFLDLGSRVKMLDPGAERPVRVITVPKTLKTPRIIAIEPACMQYTQQAILEWLVKLLEGDDILSKFIGFSDQIPNQEMAREGSRDGSLATLDLSEASDRVSNQHVRALCAPFPSLMEALDATRSRRADVPGHGVIRLSKYSSMGSALCFPLEAMVFVTIVFMALEEASRCPLTKSSVKRWFGRVRVYGDDIIVPVDYVHSVTSALEAFGLKVNTDKSFWTGKFRESCGKEYYDDIDISVVKVRRMFPTKRAHVPEIQSTVSLRNQLYWAGYWKSADYLDQMLRAIIPFPNVLDTSPALGRQTALGYDIQRWCPNLQRPLIKAFVPFNVLPKSNLGGADALLKYFLKRGDEPYDRNHLERAGRVEAPDIKLNWAPPY